MAGSGDKAEDKERWFMENFGVDAIFTPETPVVARSSAISRTSRWRLPRS